MYFFNISLVAVLLLFTNVSRADQLGITIVGIERTEGMLLLAILDSEAAFDGKQAPIASLRVPATGSSVSVSTDALQPGDYGVRVIHDVNNNGKLDTNMLGSPGEPYGFSNDATGNFGPPEWPALVFKLEGKSAITLNLVH